MAGEFVCFVPGEDGGLFVTEEYGAATSFPSELHSSKDARLRVKQPADLPGIRVDVDHLNASMMDKEAYRTAFLQQDDTLWRRIRTDGWVVALKKYLTENANNEKGLHWKVVGGALGAWERGTIALSHYLPTLWGYEGTQLAEYTNVINWGDSPIRALAWHPRVSKLAVAYSDNSVKVFSPKGCGSDITPMLKHRKQIGVTCLAWQNFSASVLAVGCQTGIIIWHVDPMSLSVRPSGTAVRFLPCQHHYPITSLAWSPDGKVLLSASVADSSIRAWDVAGENYEVLSRKEGGGNCLLKWSQDGSRVLCATARSVLRVWNTDTWTCEKWSELKGRCKTGCWSRNSEDLIFTTESEPVVYCIGFTCIQGQLEGGSTAVPIMDLRELHLPDMQSLTGRWGDDLSIQDMVWDTTCSTLALLVKGENCQGSILLFRTAAIIGGSIDIQFCGLVSESDDMFCQTLAFSSTAPVLAVVWSTGSVLYMPSTPLATEDFVYEPKEGPRAPILYSVQ